MKEISEQEMLHKLAAYCSSAERCVKDVKKKIQLAGFAEDASEWIITRLKQEKFIDERRFAQAFVNDKLRFNQWGRIKIAYELKRKAIPLSYVENALVSLDENIYNQVLMSLLKAKQKTLKKANSRELCAKLFRFASSHGFTSPEINRCLKDLGYGMGEECSDFME